MSDHSTQSSLASSFCGSKCLRHSLMSIWHWLTLTPIVLTSLWRELNASIIWEEAASKDGGGGAIWDEEAVVGSAWTGELGGGDSASLSSLKPRCAFYFIIVCFSRVSLVFSFGSRFVISGTKHMQIFVTKHTKGRLVWCSSRISSIVSIMCLQRQKGTGCIRAYKNLTLLSTSSLRRAMGHRLCCTIFTRSRWEEENTPNLLDWGALSWARWWGSKNSIISSMEGGST
jgi:hypothetical protein